MGNEKHRSASRFPKTKNFILHSHPRESIERPQWFIEKKNFGMIDQRAGECGALRHSAGKVMRIDIGEDLKPDQTHELIHFVFLFMQYSAGNEPRLDIAPHRQPRKKIWVLKNETALSVWSSDRLYANQKIARVGRIETGHETKEGGLTASTRADERNQFAGSE